MWVLFGSSFMFSNFYWLDLHNKTHVALANLWWHIYKHQIEYQTSLDLVVVIRSWYLLISWTKYIVPPSCFHYCARMANSALKCRISILITARSLCSYNNILINFGRLYSNNCYRTFSIATLGMCITCKFHQFWAVRPCIYHIFGHLTKWLILAELAMQVRY